MFHQNHSSSGHRILSISSEPATLTTRRSDGDSVNLRYSSPASDPCMKTEIIVEKIAEKPVNSGVSPEICVRQKLQRHRTDIAGQVWIPDIWGQEELLKDWVHCGAFDSSAIPTGIMSARSALVEGCRRMDSGGFSIKNGC